MPKRETLTAKISALEKKIEALKSEAEKHQKELTELDKDELYRAATKQGLTVEEAVELISEVAPKKQAAPSPSPASPAPRANPKTENTENENTEKETENE
jgi:peptidoglycan hydrolase CwlO-like protein